MCGSVIRVWGVVFCKRCRSFVDCVGILYNVWELPRLSKTIDLVERTYFALLSAKSESFAWVMAV